MAVDKNIRQSPREIFSDYLARQHKRRTPERFAILECAMRTPEHFTIESFHERLESESFHVSLATVYNTLELLVDCGLIRRHRFGSERASYERIAGTTSHHHLVCTRCGKVKEVRDASLIADTASRRYPGCATNYFSLNIYGVCRACQKRERKANASRNESSTNLPPIRNRKK